MKDTTVVIVTFNKKDDLNFCIKSLLAQTLKPNNIVIVDNNSHDGTKASLVTSGYLQDEDILTVNGVMLHYLRLDTNLGGAGGFSYGQRYSKSLGDKYIWLMDDDGYPDVDVHERLVNIVEKGVYDIVNPLVINVDNHSLLSFSLSNKIHTTEDALNSKNSNGLIEDLASPFNGTFMKLDTMNKLGVIKPEMFIWGDEAEYMMRARKLNLRIVTDVGSKFYHPSSKSIIESCMFGKIKVTTKPKKLEMNYYRNKAYLAKKYGRMNGIPGLVKLFTQYSIYFILRRELSDYKNFIRYFIDGANSRYKLPPLLE